MRSLLLSLVVLATAQGKLSENYWVWNRTNLTQREIRDLHQSGVKELYWLIGEMKWERQSWIAKGRLNPLPIIQGLKIIPVVRLEASSSSAAGNFDLLGNILSEYTDKNSVGEVQIDYDCPDRYLSLYAGGLCKCRMVLKPRHLTATALAHWPQLPAFTKLTESVDGLFPMFYDLDEDMPSEVSQGHFAVISDWERDSKRIADWEQCSVPWCAGLPVFDRLSLFATDGKLMGHLHSWNWDELIFHAAISPYQGIPPSLTLWKINQETRLGAVLLTKGETLVLRMQDRSVLKRLMDAAARAGADAIVWFRLPDDGAQCALSIHDIAGIQDAGKAHSLPTLHLDENNRLVLCNTGDEPIMPRVIGSFSSDDRGWQLEVEAPMAGAFRDATPGDFKQVVGFADPDAPIAKRVPISESQRLTFWFSHLASGESLKTGVILLNEDLTMRSKLRWRLDGGAWNPIQ